MEKKESDAVKRIREQLESYNKSDKSYAKHDPSIYFNTLLKDGEESATKTVRILPGEDGNFFQTVYLHKMQMGKQWPKFHCLKHNFDTNCPFCEANQEYYSKGDKENKELAKKYNSFPAYVLKVIDRDNEDDGVKFWRFSHDFTNKGILNKIQAIMESKGDITDPKEGRDLTINIVRDQNHNPIINSIIQDDKSPLTDDKDKAILWLGDKRTFVDVYKTRDYEYLEIIVKTGLLPVWDKEKEGYRARTENDGPVGFNNNQAKAKEEDSSSSTNGEVDGNKADDLPF